MDGLLAKAKSAGDDVEKKKAGVQAIGNLVQLVQKAKQNDTAGATEALVNLSEDLIKLSAAINRTNHPKSGSHHHGTHSQPHWTESQLLNNETDSMNYENGTGSWKDGLKEKVREYLESFNNGSYSNSTDDGNNSNDWNGFADLTNQGNSNPSDDMSIGLDLGDLSFSSKEPYDLNTQYTHPLVPSVLSSLIMITFIYYVPRLLYYRATRLSTDSQHSSFVPILYLSWIALAGAAIHLANAYYHATHNMLASLLTGTLSFDKPDFFVPMIYKALVASINRIVSPIIALLCIQQISTHSSFQNFQIFQNYIVMALYCLVSTLFVFAYSFYREYDFMLLNEDVFSYPDQIHVDPIDIITPLLTAFLFFFAKYTISRQDLYTTEKYGPNGPTTLDRVSKVVVFQLIMVFFAICAIVWSPSREDEMHLDSKADVWYYFYITAQTPVVHFVLFKSLLRSRKSTRICFLICCHSGEKVSTANIGVELNQHPRTNEPSEKNDEDEENKEANTMETLDHNKIYIIPDVGAIQRHN